MGAESAEYVAGTAETFPMRRQMTACDSKLKYQTFDESKIHCAPVRAIQPL